MAFEGDEQYLGSINHGSGADYLNRPLPLELEISSRVILGDNFLPQSSAVHASCLCTDVTLMLTFLTSASHLLTRYIRLEPYDDVYMLPIYADRVCEGLLGATSVLSASNSSRNSTEHRLSGSRMSSITSLVSLDHVLTVKDLDLSIKFYRDSLGMSHTVFASRSVEGYVLFSVQQKIT